MSYPIDYLAIGPELVVIVSMLGVLALDLVLPRRLKYVSGAVAVVGLTLAALPLILLAVRPEVASMFDGSYVVDRFSLVLKGLFLVAGYIVLIMSVTYIESDRFYQGEYYFLLLSSILGSLVMASGRDLIVLFIGLELTTAPLFMLAGWRKGDLKSNEASVKYFILGVLSTAILLWGMSMLFGVTGAVRFDEIASAVAGISTGDPAFPLLTLAVIFVMVGFGFKVSAVPFHSWAPDTYEGAPIPVTAYLSVSSKAAGFVGMFVFLYLAIPSLSSVWGPAIWVMAALSMTVANLAALRQTNIVRLLAYSSIAQAGFMLVPFAAAALSGRPEALSSGLEATVVYLLIYALMNLGAFAVVIVGTKRTGTTEIAGWAGLARIDPRLAVLTALFFFSLAGIPPLAGWYAKFKMFTSAIEAGGTWAYVLAGIAALNAVIAFAYYAKVAKAVWFDEPAADAEEVTEAPSGSLVLVLAIAAVVTLVVGVIPNIPDFLGEATRTLLAAAGG